MNWKNRTYFQGGSARPFAQAADGSRATARSKPPKEGEKPRRPFRRFLGWLFLLTLVFGAGLAVGLVEDDEAEEVWSDVVVQMNGRPQEIDKVNWRYFWDTYDTIHTRHFSGRMECRKVTEMEIREVWLDGKLKDFEPKSESCTNGFEAKYTIEGKTNDGRSLTIVFSASNWTRKVRFITVWENGRDYKCPDD